MVQRKGGYACLQCEPERRFEGAAELVNHLTDEHYVPSLRPEPLWYFLDENDEVIGTALDMEAALDARSLYPDGTHMVPLVTWRRSRDRAVRAGGADVSPRE